MGGYLSPNHISSVGAAGRRSISRQSRHQGSLREMPGKPRVQVFCDRCAVDREQASLLQKHTMRSPLPVGV
ncbi:hypothetical protein EMIT0P201_12051 [Pseudomonas chlororaphis]